MDFLIYLCLCMAAMAVIAGLWERSKRLRKSEKQILQLKQDLSTHWQSEDALRSRCEQLEARVEQLTRQIAEANHELESLLHPISHDLRAPLRAIGGFAAILRRDHAHKLDPEMARLFDRIESSAIHMGQLVDVLLAFATLKGRTLSPGPVDMDSMARSVVREMSMESASGSTRVNVERLPAAAGDPSMLRLVWASLVGNALKFSRDVAQPKIEISGRWLQSHSVYFVRDNGVGFDMQHSKRLFQLFHRLHATEQFEGTGAGLATVQRIIRRHGGLVWAEGRRGEGATFSFALPHDADPDGHAFEFQRDGPSGKLRTH
jgi:light-regulated signal transduction histidine kinase (bacteriophytochrome)